MGWEGEARQGNGVFLITVMSVREDRGGREEDGENRVRQKGSFPSVSPFLLFFRFPLAFFFLLFFFLLLFLPEYHTNVTECPSILLSPFLELESLEIYRYLSYISL